MYKIGRQDLCVNIGIATKENFSFPCASFRFVFPAAEGGRLYLVSKYVVLIVDC